MTAAPQWEEVIGKPLSDYLIERTPSAIDDLIEDYEQDIANALPERTRA